MYDSIIEFTDVNKNGVFDPKEDKIEQEIELADLKWSCLNEGSMNKDIK